MKAARRRIEVNLEELDRVLDGARQAPLSESDHGKLKEALHALAAMLVRPRNTEKSREVLEKPEDSETGTQPDNNTPPPPGVRERQRVRAEGAEGAGADRGTSATGGYGLRTGAVALRRLRAGVHGP